jgi:hypothetical protein
MLRNRVGVALGWIRLIRACVIIHRHGVLRDDYLLYYKQQGSHFGSNITITHIFFRPYYSLVTTGYEPGDALNLQPKSESISAPPTSLTNYYQAFRARTKLVLQINFYLRSFQSGLSTSPYSGLTILNRQANRCKSHGRI